MPLQVVDVDYALPDGLAVPYLLERQGINKGGLSAVLAFNGSCYRSFAFRNACRRLGLEHIRTRPYTPKTNGKAERFVQTCLREWAYARAYSNSRQRAQELPFFTHRYNWHRPHSAIAAN